MSTPDPKEFMVSLRLNKYQFEALEMLRRKYSCTRSDAVRAMLIDVGLLALGTADDLSVKLEETRPDGVCLLTISGRKV